MSPILDIQRRHAELFRIRLGERRVAANGHERPAALDGQIRITSPSAEVIEAVSDAYGGVTSAWGEWMGKQSRSHMDALMIKHLQREVRRLREERRFTVGTTRSGKSAMIPREFFDQDRQQVWLFKPDMGPRAIRDKDGGS